MSKLARMGRFSGALAVAIASLAGCSASPAPQPVPTTVDCSIEAQYIIRPVETYEGLTAFAPWFSYGDNTPGARHTGPYSAQVGRLPTLPIEGSGLCDSKNALVLATEGHKDYGSGFGSYCLGSNYNGPNSACVPANAIDTDGTPFEGFTFWARDPAMPLDHMPGDVITNIILDGGLEGAVPITDKLIDSGFYDAQVLQHATQQGPFTPTATTKNVTIAFDDRHSSSLADYWNTQLKMYPNPNTQPFPNPCTVPGNTTLCQTITDSQGVMTQVGSGCMVVPNQCGNSFSRTLTLTDQWHLYLLPFSSFGQSITPSRTSEPPDLTTIFTFAMRMPKESVDEVWIARLGFYRKRP